jgi:hypothetical protein
VRTRCLRRCRRCAGFVTLAARRAQPRFGRGERPLRIFDAARRDGALGEQPGGAGLFGAGALERALGLRDFGGQRGAIVTAGEPRF